MGSTYNDTFKRYSKNLLNQLLNYKRSFIQFIPTMKSLPCYSTTSENKICHHDLNYRNITSKYKNVYLIDFGLSFKFNVWLKKESIAN